VANDLAAIAIFPAIGEQLANPPANGKHEPMPPNPAANKRKGILAHFVSLYCNKINILKLV
jgi:hypothetical protein